MRRRALWIALSAVAIALIASIVLSVPKLAHACGGFFSRKVSKIERKPSLAYEQTLILYDDDKHREHFVREVVFRASNEKFGFVVPTPSRPEVAKVAKSPFSELQRRFPFWGGEYGLGLIGTVGGGSGQGFGKGPGVKVLEVTRVGSFTAFVLAADDAKALSEWLEKNHLATTPESDAWLAHYVRMKFFYVAMRYDPLADQAPTGRMKAETVRISFDSPLAYYPYLEPNPPAGLKPDEPRMLEVWLVARSQTVPVVARKEGDTVRWIRPFAEGKPYEHVKREELEALLGPDKGLLFEGDLCVQRFVDQKQSRVGFGDVLFAPMTKMNPKLEQRKRLLELAPMFDPSLEAEK